MILSRSAFGFLAFFLAAAGGFRTACAAHPFSVADARTVEAPFRFLGPNSYANTLAIRGDTVVAGGLFDGAEDFASGSILKWDGSRWTEGYPGIEYGVLGLKWSGDRLYAVGFFDRAGACDSCQGSAYWENGAWHGMGTGFKIGDFPRGLAWLGDTLLACANSGLYRWTGHSWIRFGPEMKGQPAKMEVYAGKLWLAGEFDAAPGVANLMRWDNGSWSTPAGTDLAKVIDIEWHDGALFMLEEYGFAPADFRVSRYDGKAWEEVTGDVFGSFAGRMVSDGKNLYMTGEFANGFCLFRWDGSAFKILDFRPGLNGETQCLAVTASGKLIQSANMYGIGARRVDYFSQWDGKEWAPMTSGQAATGVAGYPSAIGSDGKRLFLGGESLRWAGSRPAPHVVAWDGGSAWDTLDGGLNSVDPNTPVEVYAWASGRDGMYAGGHFASAGASPALNVARWDGSAWHPLGDGFPGTVLALAASGEDMIAAGRGDPNQAPGGNSLPAGHSIGKWHAGAWSSFGSGLYGTVNAAAEYKGTLYAAGHFALSPGGARCGLAAWDGKAWSALPDDPTDSLPLDSVYALAVFQGRLFALGREMSWEYPWKEALMAWDGKGWEYIDRVTQATHLVTDGNGLFLDPKTMPDISSGYVNAARFDGQNWIFLGPGTLAPDLRSIGLSGGYLYLSGWLHKLGGVPAAWLARWNVSALASIRPQRTILARRKGGLRKYMFLGQAELDGSFYRADGRKASPGR